MNRDREEKKKRKTRLIQQLQERNNILEDKILRLQDDWNINQRVIEELQEEQYTSSSEAEETSSILSVEFIESTPQEERKPEARRIRQTIGTLRLTQPQTPIPRKKTKKEEREEGLERAIAWARDRKNHRAGKK
jgi:DNA mismatch repair ATPase MutS